MGRAPFVVTLTAVNIGILGATLGAATLAQAGSAETQDPAPVLRGRALELVDVRGQIRARMNVEPSGEVVLRLLDRRGTIRVKLGAGEDGSGLLLANDATEPGVHLLAKAEGSSVTVTNKDGRRTTVAP